MELTPEHKKTLEKYLTKAARKKMMIKIKESGCTLSDRQIRNVLKGESPDYHGILNIAIKEASYVKQSETHTKKRLDKLAS